MPGEVPSSERGPALPTHIRKEPLYMRLSSPFSLGLAAVAALLVGTLQASIERLDLPEMVSKADNAVIGTIVDKEVVRIDHPIDGPELYYTHLLIRGRSVYDGSEITVPVTFPGGFVAPGQGVYNSEAPSADETKVGTRVLAFYAWSDNMGGELAANALYASHGGLYRVVSGRREPIVLGRGFGYAVDRNYRVSELETSVRSHLEAKPRGK